MLITGPFLLSNHPLHNLNFKTPGVQNSFQRLTYPYLHAPVRNVSARSRPTDDAYFPTFARLTSRTKVYYHAVSVVLEALTITLNSDSGSVIIVNGIFSFVLSWRSCRMMNSESNLLANAYFQPPKTDRKILRLL